MGLQIRLSVVMLSKVLNSFLQIYIDSAELQYFQCVSNGDTVALHQVFEMVVDVYLPVTLMFWNIGGLKMHDPQLTIVNQYILTAQISNNIIENASVIEGLGPHIHSSYSGLEAMYTFPNPFG